MISDEQVGRFAAHLRDYVEKELGRLVVVVVIGDHSDGSLRMISTEPSLRTATLMLADVVLKLDSGQAEKIFVVGPPGDRQ